MSQPPALNGSSRPRVCPGDRVFHVLAREDPGEQLMQPCSRMYYAVLRGTSAAYQRALDGARGAHLIRLRRTSARLTVLAGSQR